MTTPTKTATPTTTAPPHHPDRSVGRPEGGGGEGEEGRRSGGGRPRDDDRRVVCARTSPPSVDDDEGCEGEGDDALLVPLLLRRVADLEDTVADLADVVLLLRGERPTATATTTRQGQVRTYVHA